MSITITKTGDFDGVKKKKNMHISSTVIPIFYRQDKKTTSDNKNNKNHKGNKSEITRNTVIGAYSPFMAFR